MGEEVSIQEIFHILKKRSLLILSLTAITMIIVGIISYFVITPTYEATSQILVNQSGNENNLYDSNEVETNVQLIKTYRIMIKSSTVLEKVKDELNLDYSIDDLNNIITVSSEDDTQIMSITVEDKSIKSAVRIANKTAEVFQKEIADIMNINNVTIITEAKVKGHETPVKPNRVLNLAIAMVVGLTVGVGLAFLLAFLDHTLKTEKDIETRLNLPVIGVISKLSKRTPEPQKLIINNEQTTFTEQYRTMRTNIEYAEIKHELKSIMVTSVNPGEGKSITAANLATAFAQEGRKVLLLDADLRGPNVHNLFKADNLRGLSTILSGKATLDQVVTKTKVDNLSILTSGPASPDPTKILVSKDMGSLLEILNQQFDLVILDVPSILAVSDAQILAKFCDAATIVVSSGETEIEQAQKAKKILEKTSTKLLGVILNKKKSSDNDY
ncbi:polysaccharide biosynthesis tyrosine autokinase [Bacillus sp. AGMB 02131]|uniref:non-specific protein-tyrosine kinase n=1 Tax=Peribacillus faecalis TaxID=2772559 RepID=A0A927CVP2_9BACI|nr:polysaccharide biosynthesis tyrosine autokinase [Peribacillus faecalis]MBD3107622.1 polysaccharide biosynthesis tyrosine autokinase [Peribacillus faecalis]